jgi:simple sugar transport system ATP-binding protein
VHAPSLDTPVRVLSGGNLQRLLLARELATHPILLIAFHPTRGLDVQATAAVHRLLLDQRQRGTAILLISEDLEELFILADRIAVLYQGQMRGTFHRAEAEREVLGLLMAGAGQSATV